MPAPQAPIGSGFGASSTAAEVVNGCDLTGKTIVVTGGYSGIGLESIRAFRSAGAKVIVPARDVAKAKANLADMPDVGLEFMDLLDPGAIDTRAEHLLRDKEERNTLVNNAGIIAPPHARDARGHPGGVITDLIRYMSIEEVRAYGVLDEHERPIIDPARNMKTPEQGAATSVWRGTSPRLERLGGCTAKIAILRSRCLAIPKKSVVCDPDPDFPDEL